MKKRTIFKILAGLFAISLLAAACGDSDDADITTATTAAPDTGGATETTAAPDTGGATDTTAAAEPEPAEESMAGQGGTVTLLYWQAPTNLNPYLSGGTKEIEAASLVIEPLAEYNQDGVLIAALATEIPTVENGGISADLSSITWTIQDGVTWSDGSAFTADDVVFTWEYCTDPDGGCAQSANFDGVVNVTAVDDSTVLVEFDAPKPFPYVAFVSSTSPIISRAQFGDCTGTRAVECTDENFGPIGTGPYKAVEFRTNDTARYEYNENYRGSSAGLPFFGEVILKGGGDAAAAARSVLQLNEADYAWNLQVEPEILNAMADGGGGTVLAAFATNVERLMINQTNPDSDLGENRSEYVDGTNPHPFLTDPIVGRALSLAIDRDTLVAVGYGSAGRPTCNVWPAPPAQTSTNNDECLVQNLDLAKQLLDDAGYVDSDGDGVREHNGTKMSILYQTSTNSVRQTTQELVKSWWEDLGFEVELRNIDASVFFGGDISSPDTYAKFYADIEMYTNGTSGTDPQSYMGNWTTAQIPGAHDGFLGSNIQRFQSDEFDTLFEELQSTSDIQRRNEITIALNDLLVANYSIIPLIHRGSVSARANDIDGVLMNAWDTELWNIEDWTRN